MVKHKTESQPVQPRDNVQQRVQPLGRLKSAVGARLNARNARRLGAAALRRAQLLRLATVRGVRKHGPGVRRALQRAAVGGVRVLRWSVVTLAKSAALLARTALSAARAARQPRVGAVLPHAPPGPLAQQAAAARAQPLAADSHVHARLHAAARELQAARAGAAAALARQQAAAAVKLRAGGAQPQQRAAPAAVGRHSALHHELVAFAAAATPTAAERASRSAAVAALRAAVRGLWQGADLVLFGSTATGLGLPSADLDVVVLGGPCGAHMTDVLPGGAARARERTLAALHLLKRALLRRKAVRSARVLSARVPIIKCITHVGRYECDVGIGAANGAAAVPLVAALCARHPALRPLVLVLKAFLEQRDLVSPFKGCIGGYALVNLVAAYLQQAEQRSGVTHGGADLGDALHAFLRLYGTFDCGRDAVAVLRGGVVPRSALSCGASGGTAFALVIEDPQPPHKDIGAAAFNFRAVRHAFATAANALDGHRLAHAHGPPRTPSAAALLADAKAQAPVLSRIVDVAHALRRGPAH